MIVPKMIGWVGDPVGGYRDIGLHHFEGHEWVHGEVVFNHILGFYSILYEEIMAMDPVSYILRHM